MTNRLAITAGHAHIAKRQSKVPRKNRFRRKPFQSGLSYVSTDRIRERYDFYLKGMLMRLYLLVAAVTVIIGACATRPSFTDMTVQPERKAYARCAVYMAFSIDEWPKSAWSVAREAVSECDQEQAAVLGKLRAENALRPEADAYAASYMQHLNTSMINHIAVRLMQARLGERPDQTSGDAGKP